MKLKTLATALLALLLAGPALAQQAGGGQPDQVDQVDQLTRLVGLDENQQKKIREILEGSQAEIATLQMEARELQQTLQEQAGPDYDEASIRKNAERLGDLTGEMTAMSVLLQSKVESVFTPAQREELERKMQQQQQMRQQQMQQQMQ